MSKHAVINAVQSKQLAAELAALDVLRGAHSYMIFELTPKAERSTMMYRRGTDGATARVPAVGIKLVVPETSVLGKEILAMRKRKAQVAKAAKTAATRRKTAAAARKASRR